MRTRKAWSVLLILIARVLSSIIVSNVLSMLSIQAIRHIRENRRLTCAFFALNIPIKNSMKRIIELSRGGILYAFMAVILKLQ
jgi:hypothetical protein